MRWAGQVAVQGVLHVEGDVDRSASVLMPMSSLTLRTPVRYVTACSAAVRSLP